MRSVSNSAETINAAATVIASAEARVQPETAPKRRWGSCWSLCWCFGSHKHSKRIGHAVFVPEAVVTRTAVPSTQNAMPSSTLVLPFIAPPSSPASFLQSDPPSATQSPAGLLPVTALSVHTQSSCGPASIYAVGPYAYETQLVTPPVFSAFTTEPSTAPLTPPSESVQLTTPSSPEVPFAQLLTSSLDRTQRNFGSSPKLAISPYDFLPCQPYPGSPGGHLRSPGSAVSTSGTSSPFPDGNPILEFRKGEALTILGFEHFTAHRSGSRIGSGTMTPDGAGLRSKVGSGTLTPDAMGLGSRLGSGTLTPDYMGLGSRLESGTLTPDGIGLRSQLGSGSLTPSGTGLDSKSGSLTPDGLEPAAQASQVTPQTSLENPCQNDGSITYHRVSFEFTGEDVARCLANKLVASFGTVSQSPLDTVAEGQNEDRMLVGSDELLTGETSNQSPGKVSFAGKDHRSGKECPITLAFKEFNFDNANGEVKPPEGSQWWSGKKGNAATEAAPGNNWTFFPMLQPGVR